MIRRQDAAPPFSQLSHEVAAGGLVLHVKRRGAEFNSSVISYPGGRGLKRRRENGGIKQQLGLERKK